MPPTPAPQPVLVTGGAGRVGRYVVRELRERGPVRVADLVPGERAEEYVACDVLDLDQVRAAVAGTSAICHLGGLDYDTASAPEDFVRVNTVGTWHVLQAAAEHGVRKVVLASSSAAYGLFSESPEWLPQYLPVDEEHECRSYDAYSASKLATEAFGETWHRATGMSVICLQPMHVVMEETIEHFTAFVRDPPPRWPHNWVHAQDVATAFERAIAVEGIGFDRFLVSAADTPLADPTLEWYPDVLGPLPELRDAEAYRRDPRASLFSTERARERLGWAPRRTLADLGLTPVARPALAS
jgi:nucleoside-diphosphate-sugar epimerase